MSTTYHLDLSRVAEHFPDKPEVVKGLAHAMGRELNTQHDLLCQYCQEANRVAIVSTLRYIAEISFVLSADEVYQHVDSFLANMAVEPEDLLKKKCLQLCTEIRNLQLDVMTLLNTPSDV